VPSTGIAPFSYVVPSTGWLMLRVGAWIARNGTVIRIVRGVSAYPTDVTAQMVRNFIAGGAAINQLTAQIDGDLRIYEMDLAHPTEDFTIGPAMDETRCARAMAYGMMAVEPGIDVLCVGEMGIGNTSSAAALCLALYGGAAGDWVGPGTGIAGAGLSRKLAAVAQGVKANRALLDDPLHLLRAVGGEDVQALIRRAGRFNWHRDLILALVRQPRVATLLFRTLFR